MNLKTISLISMILTLSACAKPADGRNGSNGADGLPGTKGNTGEQGPQGNQGQTGATGANGAQGYGAGIKTVAVSPGATCANGGVELDNYQDLDNNGVMDASDPLISLSYVCNGTNGTNGANGSNGTNGSNGVNGVNGSNGSNGADGISSTFSVVADSGAHCSNGGYDITLTDVYHSETDYVCNGTNGSNGQNGQAGTNGTNGANGGTISFNLVQAIMPCGAASSPWKEVLLGLQGGQLLSSFSESASGTNTRFSFIPNGTYSDTDSSGCQFTVTGDGSTVSDIHWNAGSNGYSSWAAAGYHWTQALGWVGY